MGSCPPPRGSGILRLWPNCRPARRSTRRASPPRPCQPCPISRTPRPAPSERDRNGSKAMLAPAQVRPRAQCRKGPLERAPTSSSRAAHSSRQCHAVPTATHHATRTRGFNAAPMTGSLSGFPSCFQTPCKKEALDQWKGRVARAVCAGGGACNPHGQRCQQSTRAGPPAAR